MWNLPEAGIEPVFPALAGGFFFSFLYFIFYLLNFYFNWRLITLQYCGGFAIHSHASATGVHVFPIPSLRVVPVHQPWAPCLMHQTWTGDLFHIWQYTCFNAILSNHPTLSLSHRVQQSVLYICVSFAVSHTGLSLHLSKFHICALVYYTGVFLSGLLHSV